jgi:hypothetical protein
VTYQQVVVDDKAVELDDLVESEAQSNGSNMEQYMVIESGIMHMVLGQLRRH